MSQRLKIFVNLVSDKGFISGTYEEHFRVRKKQTTLFFFKVLMSILPKKTYICMADKHFKTCSTSLDVRKMEVHSDIPLYTK